MEIARDRNFEIEDPVTRIDPLHAQIAIRIGLCEYVATVRIVEDVFPNEAGVFRPNDGVHSDFLFSPTIAFNTTIAIAIPDTIDTITTTSSSVAMAAIRAISGDITVESNMEVCGIIIAHYPHAARD